MEKGYEVPFGYEEAIGFMFGEVRGMVLVVADSAHSLIVSIP